MKAVEREYLLLFIHAILWYHLETSVLKLDLAELILPYLETWDFSGGIAPLQIWPPSFVRFASSAPQDCC